MKELNNKQTKNIACGYYLLTAGGVVLVTGIATAICSFISGNNAAFRQLRAEKQINGENITYLDSSVDAELAALAHYNKYGGRNFDTLTNDQFGRPSAPPLED